MSHTISVTIPNTCDCELLADGEIVPVHWISIQIDIHTRKVVLAACLQLAIPANAEKLEVKLEHHQIPIHVVPLLGGTSSQFALQSDMELVDQDGLHRLLEYLKALVIRLDKPSPGK